MIIKRRNFLQTSVYLVGAILYPRKNIISSLSSLTLEGIREIRPNVGVFTKRGGTIGWYITDDALVVVDSQFPDSAQVFIDELKQKTERRIDVLFNTHHHGDHTSGNFYLKDFADKIVACENCVKLQQKFYGTGEKSEKQVYAGSTFKKEWELDLGNEKIKAYHFSSAHTGGDAFIQFDEAKVAHMGDLSDEYVTGNLDDVVTMRDYYSALRDFMIKEIKAGKSLNEIEKAKHVPGFESLPERYDGEKNKNLKAAYEEFS
jgi:glyoxylase-like metal-dependent hydrolase (beta-lactamase superfamily II)